MRVIRGMVIRRAVAAERHAARLTYAQMNPHTTDLYTIFTLSPLRMFDGRNLFDVSARFLSHHHLLYSLSN
jgi:hypothetical protein